MNLEVKNNTNNKPYVDFLSEVKLIVAENGIAFSDLNSNGLAGWLYIATCAVGFYISAIVFLFGVNVWLVAPVLGVFLMLHCQYLSHESIHGSVSSSRKINRWLSLYATGVIGYGEFIGDHLKHHKDTNHVDEDPDFISTIEYIFGGTGGWVSQHKGLVYYVGSPILALLIMFDRIYNSFKYSFPNTNFSFKEIFFHKSVFLLSFFFLNICPFIVFGLSVEAVYATLVPRLVQWFIIMQIFQWNHFYDDSGDDLVSYVDGKAKDEDFFTHILKTTNNVCERNPILQYLLVGNQIQHHLVPTVSASKTHLFIDATRKVADKYGLKVSHTESIRAQLRNSCVYLKV